MFIGLATGLVLGVAANLTLGASPRLEWFVKHLTEPAGKIFLRLLFMLVIPLILSALALGVSGLGDLKRLGRIGLKTLAYTVVVSTIAVLIGVGMVNLFKPGTGLSPALKQRLAAQASAAPAAAPSSGGTGVDFLVGLVPNNIVKAMGDGDMLAVMVFALFLGIGLAVTRTESARRLEEALEGLYDVVMRLLGMVIQVAPVGVACLLFTLTARLGFDVLKQLGAYVLVVVGALALHQFGVYSLSVWWLGRMSPVFFFRSVRDAMVTAFSTASSNATLPTSLLVAEQNLKLPPHVSRFVLTIGSTANQNGTALFEGVTVLFLAQFFGVHLTLAQQITVCFICVLGGIGTAGVPAGSIPVVVMILGMVGIPPEGIGMILGVDRFLDMCRTTLNVTGDLAAAVVVSRGEAARAPVAGD
ncbi:MAG: dicarboxylate/amino acid:cation symporter [Candidatus Eisenbacteria bacterium]|uniref:Dicarboxylate/amino acid:cation symporter n=1 Tax=Eiseniibacteriota bacterium TaxID=2212470 RepID=A0A538U4P7_UNCEI|nr:MAG: dicarboxylate/amino acid:cation symporter [Candidatus Eisenbacteria bacterium]